MAWFDWLAGGVDACPDCIWLSADAKWRGVAKTIQLRLASPDRPTALLVAAHFPQTLHDLRTACSSEELNHDCVRLTTVESLLAAAETAMGLRRTDCLEIIVVERHFLPEPDARLSQFAQMVPCRCRLMYHLSLHDPLLRDLKSGWLEQILRQMGMKDDEAIQSRPVSRRIRAAQHKFARRSSPNHLALSAEEWLSRNAG